MIESLQNRTFASCLLSMLTGTGSALFPYSLPAGSHPFASDSWASAGWGQGAPSTGLSRMSTGHNGHFSEEILQPKQSTDCLDQALAVQSSMYATEGKT